MRYVSKPKPLDLRRIERLGANPGYFQLEHGEVIYLAHHCEVQIGDHILFVDDEPVDILNPAELRFEAMLLTPDIDPAAVEEQVIEVEFVDGDPTTVCALAMKDGRSFSGSATVLNIEKEERRQYAYNNAMEQAFSEEVRFLQRLHHFFNEGS